MRTPFAIVVCVSVGLPSLAFGRVVPISSVTASSTETERGGQSFDASYLYDGKQRTAWVEGDADSGLGSWVQLEFGEETEVSAIRIWNGNWSTSDYWQRFNRVDQIEISFSDGTRENFSLDDSQAIELIELSTPVRTSSIRLKALSVHGGRTFNATGYSEIQVLDSQPDGHIHPVGTSDSSHFPTSLEGSYGADNLVDGIGDTMWCEGDEGDGNGQWVEMDFGESRMVGQLTLANGNGFGFAEFMAFNRASGIELQFSDGSTEALTVLGSPMEQVLSFDARRTQTVRMTITGVTAGTNEHNMLCLSEVRFRE